MHPNEELLRRFYGGDRKALRERMAPDYVAHVPGSGAAAGDYHGPEGHARHVEVLTSLSGGSLSKQLPGTFLADDHWGLVPSLLTAQRGGERLAVQGFGLWRFREGAVAEHWGLVADQPAFDAFFG